MIEFRITFAIIPTVSTSNLKPLKDLNVLEVRGHERNNLKFVFDLELPNIQYMNLESIELVGSEVLQRRPESEMKDPSDTFSYIPNSEKFVYNVSLDIEEEIEILPYEVYKMETRRSKYLSFYGWKQLIVIRIHDCVLDELQWETFDGLTNLQHLSLEHNAIKVLAPFTFYGAMNLKFLSLAHNEILDLHYRALAGLLELESLDLSYNNLTKLSEISFPPFPKLSKVDLRYNPIKYVFPYTFAVMNNTKKMYLGDNSVAIELIDKQAFELMDNLNYLLINNLNLNVLTQSTFKGIKSLEELKIRGITKLIEFDAFSETANLKQLDMMKCGIEEISMDAFLGSKKLEIVQLANNKLKYLPPGLFDDQVYLREIYLENNLLTELPTNFFFNTAAKLIRLINNPWHCNCDIINWNQGLTNSDRKVTKTNKCSYQNYKDITCKTDKEQIAYIFDNKLSPRCMSPDSMKNRSVYYSVRKNLKCLSAVKSTNQHQNNNTSIMKKNENKHKMYRKKVIYDLHKLHVEEKMFRTNIDLTKLKRQHFQEQNFLNKVKTTMNNNLDMTGKFAQSFKSHSTLNQLSSNDN